MADTVIIEANKTARTRLALGTAESDIITFIGTTLSETYSTIKTTFSGMTNDQLLKYVYLDQIVGGEFKNKKVSVDVPTSIQTELGGL